MRSCDSCPARGVCRTLVRIAKSRFNAHIDHICPYKVCVHLGFCNQTSQVEKPAIKQIDDSNSTCILCEYVMNILSNYIHRQSTEKEIEDNLQKVCNEMPTVLQNQCHDYINNYGPSIIAILLQEFDVSAICHKLNLCTKQMKVDVTHLIKADTATCGICDYISTYFHFELQRDSKEKSFQHALSTVCSHLSEEQKPKCQTIIQLFSPHIHQLELSPGKSFCKQLTICLTPMIQLKPSILLKNEPAPEPMDIDTLLQPNVKDQLTETPKCALCHYVISYLDAALKNNISEQAVEQALEKVCTILPGTFNRRIKIFICRVFSFS
jgi:saposin